MDPSPDESDLDPDPIGSNALRVGEIRIRNNLFSHEKLQTVYFINLYLKVIICQIDTMRCFLE